MKRFKKYTVTLFLVVAVSISVSYKSDFFEIAKQIEIYTTLFKELNLYYIDEINPAEVMDEAIEHTLSNLDPYTRFYDEQGVIDARIRAEGEYGGIGATIEYRDGNLLIKEIFEDYPAHKSGLLAGDIIFKIDNTILKNQEREFVMAQLKGLSESTIKVQVQRQEETFEADLTRETVEISPVPFYEMIDDEVGYIAFTKFNKKASDEVKNAFEDLKSQGMTSLIIDVRHNPGGLLNEAVEIVNFFIPKNKVVVTTKAKLDKWSNTYKTKNEPLDTEIPLAILIDDRSASASEILAGALQDYDRAVVVGQRSFGKGLVQRSRKLSYGTQLKLTISKYYTPSGRCIQELDYTNRDGADVPKFSDGDINEFKTENGRTVYDGGGVTPDISNGLEEKNEVFRRFLNSDVLFDYTTEYYYKHQTIEDSKNFSLTTSDFNTLKKYVLENSEGFQLKPEKELDALIETLKENDIAVEKEFLALKAEIHSQKVTMLDDNKEEILDYLESEIVRRYYFKNGEYQQKLQTDETIKSAVNLFKENEAYLSILDKK